MQQDTAAIGGPGPQRADTTKVIEPSFRSALPHYLPLAAFPLIYAALIYGGWWLLPPMLFFAVSGPLDRVLGLDGRVMNPMKTPERRLLWHNIPVWTWAFLWPPTLIFGMWQILVADAFAIWEDLLLAIILTMEAQAVFIVGHEMIHRRAIWERRIGEFLLACASYPQYATEHVYIHHAQVGTPQDVGSAPKGESFWRYFPKEIVSNLTNSWKVSGERLARSNLPRWHYSNPFWRYGLYIAFWYGLAYWMGGFWILLIFAFLGFGCVFSMKISNYMQHYGLRRVRLPNGRWEKVMPRHSWSADWRYSNWMFFNMQRHADHHALATRQYPLLQIQHPDESPQLPGSYSDMMGLVLRPKRWFEKMDPLVDQWRKHFYPEIEDWSAYDSPVSAARPDALDAIIEIFGTAPRFAKWVERTPELLDTLQDREFTDIDLPTGFGPDLESEAIARRGLARLYWTREMGVQEMKDQIAEIPAADAKEIAEILRNWSNDKAFQIGMHLIRGNLSPAEARVALSNLAEASITSVLGAIEADFVHWHGPLLKGGIAAFFLGDFASREVQPGGAIEILFVHNGLRRNESDRICDSIRASLTDLARDSLLFSPIARGTDACVALPLGEVSGHYRKTESNACLDLTRTRAVFDSGDADIGSRFNEIQREILADWSASDSLVSALCQPPDDSIELGVSSYRKMPGGLDHIERAARLLQLKGSGAAPEDPAPTAAALFIDHEPLVRAASLWRDVQSVLGLVCQENFDAATTGPKVKSLIATACGYGDYDALNSTVAEVAIQAAQEIDVLVAHA